METENTHIRNNLLPTLNLHPPLSYFIFASFPNPIYTMDLPLPLTPLISIPPQNQPQQPPM